jgi:hypothetical protein
LPETQTKAIVAAANAFLATLSAEQRKAVQFEFLRPKTASGTQFNMGNMKRGPGGPPNGRPPGNGDTSRRPPNRGGQAPVATVGQEARHRPANNMAKPSGQTSR